jgi:hypothetical protein
MFNSTILDVIAGLIFGFLAVGLISSTLVEAINSALKVRSRSLLSGVKQLVNDASFNALALALYQHASINPRGLGTSQGAKTRLPAYIAIRQRLAGCHRDVCSERDGGCAHTGSNRRATGRDRECHGSADQELVKRYRAADERRLRADQGGTRPVVRRRDGPRQRGIQTTQLASFLLALIISVALNVDSIRVARGLWEQPTISERLKLPVQRILAGSSVNQPAANTDTQTGSVRSPGSASPTNAPQGSAEAVAALSALEVLDENLPVG